MSFPIGPFLIGAAVGAAVTYFVTRQGSANPFARNPLEKGLGGLEKGANDLARSVEQGVAKAKSAVQRNNPL